MNYQTNVQNDPVLGNMRNPRDFTEDLDPTTYHIEPNIMPIYNVLSHLSKGPKATQAKVNYRVECAEMLIDKFVNPIFGGSGSTSPGWERFCLVTPTNEWNPNISQVLYHPQDHIYNPETGQEYEVVMTPTESIQLIDGAKNDTNNYLGGVPTTLTGSTATRTAAGTILLKNVQPFSITPFTEAIIYPGPRSYFDGQDRGGHSTFQEAFYDCNYVQNFEFSQTWYLEAVEDFEVKYPSMKFDPTFQMNLKKEIMKEEFACLFGNKSYDVIATSQSANGQGQPKRTMQGILNGTTTNVSYYQPFGLTDAAFERVIQEIISEQGIMYGDISNKLVCAGTNIMKRVARLMTNRRVVDMDLNQDKKVVVSTDTYEFMGHTIQFVPCNLFHEGKYRDWLFMWDPTEIKFREMRTRQERWLQTERERKVERHYEHKFTITMPKEMNNVLLRTY